MMGFAALHVASIGLGKRVTRQEPIEYLDEMNELGLIRNTSNSVDNSIVICIIRHLQEFEEPQEGPGWIDIEDRSSLELA